MLRVAVPSWLPLCLLVVACTQAEPTVPREGRLLVVLGSSTAAGMGASSPSASCIGLVTRHARAMNATDGVWNLARPGFTTWSILPAPVRGEQRRRPPNLGRNVTRALSAHPYAILLSLPTNDTLAGVPVPEQRANFERIAQVISDAGVRLFVMSSQPRNFPGPLRAELFDFRGWLQQRFAPTFIDAWSDLVGPEHRLRADLDSGDGTHVNDAGHLILATRIVRANVFGR